MKLAGIFALLALVPVVRGSGSLSGKPMDKLKRSIHKSPEVCSSLLPYIYFAFFSFHATQSISQRSHFQQRFS